MTYQILYKNCKFCDNAMNHCGDRGNGRQRDYCDTECQRKMYMIKKRIANYMAQMKLRNCKFDVDGEFTQNIFDFIQMASTYIENGLPAKRISFHVNAALEGRNSMAVAAVFACIIENKGKDNA